jgi:hypothetical protein
MEPEPRADRPQLPAGYLTPKLLTWSWAETRLARSRNYWVATVTPAGTPHARPVWGVWLDRRFFFSSGSRIRTNTAANPRLSIHLESGDECVIVEGVASELHEAGLVRRVTDAYNTKYNWNFEAKPGEFFAVQPQVAFAWLCDGTGLDGGALFGQTATRFRFESIEGQPLAR